MNGYGTIGRRVAGAILKQPDMELVGVTKATPDYRVDEAQARGIKVFSIDGTKPFQEAGYAVEGCLDDLLQLCDIVVDCAPKGKGKENLAIYSKYPQLKAIFQGGEKHELTGLSFNSDCNYEQAAGKRFARVVSCNTTALCRIISTLNTNFQIRKVRATLVRRSADQSDGENSIINTWVPDTGFPSHHSHDVKHLMPDLKITTLAGVAPMTLMHGHMLFIELENPNRQMPIGPSRKSGNSPIAQSAAADLRSSDLGSSKPADAQGVIETLQRNPRILVCSAQKGLTSTAKLKDLFAVSGNNRNGDIYEICVWKEGIGVDSDGEIGMHIAIDQQADVVPENIDAIRAMCGTADRQQSITLTNQSLGIGIMRGRSATMAVAQAPEALIAMPAVPSLAKDL